MYRKILFLLVVLVWIPSWILFCEERIKGEVPGYLVHASGRSTFAIPSDSSQGSISVAQVPSDLDLPEIEEAVDHSGTPLLLGVNGDIKDFIVQYVAGYTRKDLEGFLSFFSPKCVQNRKQGFEEIGKIYSDLFNESQKIRYDLYDVHVKTYEEGALVFGRYYFYVAEVNGRYEMDRVLKRGGRRLVRQGDIGWILIKENGALRILSLDDSNFADTLVSWSDGQPVRGENVRDAPDRGGKRDGEGEARTPGDVKGVDGDGNGGKSEAGDGSGRGSETGGGSDGTSDPGDGNGGAGEPGNGNDGSGGPGNGSGGGSQPGDGDGTDGGDSDMDGGKGGKAKGHDPGHSKGKGKGRSKGKAKGKDRSK
jgi:hypothetical protein